MSIDTEIAAIKSRIEALQLAKVRAQVNKESAQKILDETMLTLKDRFGLDSLDQVRGKLGELQADLESKKAEVDAMLSKHKF